MLYKGLLSSLLGVLAQNRIWISNMFTVDLLLLTHPQNDIMVVSGEINAMLEWEEGRIFQN